MNVADAARLINVSPDTVRRWCADFSQFLSPSATPKKGATRVLTSHDAAVLSFVSTSRESGLSMVQINDQLVEMQANGWNGLPEIPPSLIDPGPDEVMPIETAALRASQVAQIAALNVELQHTRLARDKALESLEVAQQRVRDLESEIASLQTAGVSTEKDLSGKLHSAELALERAKSQVSLLEGRLQGYAFGVSREPLSPVVLAAFITVFVFVAFLVALGVLWLVQSMG